MMDCEFCRNCGGQWVPAIILRKRTYIFKPCPHCQRDAARERSQLTLQEMLEVNYPS